MSISRLENIDASVFFVDPSDKSRKLKLLLNSLTGTKNITIPNSSTTMVGTDAIQTLTNKTMIGSTNTIAASQLRSKGSDIVISDADQPTAGQVLTATSSSTANWQTPIYSNIIWTITSDGGSYSGISNNGYCNTSNDKLMTITLPKSPSVGDMIHVVASDNGGWRISQNASQSIIITNIRESKSFTANWLIKSTNDRNYSSIAISKSGINIIVAVHGGFIYLSSNSGTTWTALTNAGSRNWTSVAFSDDATIIIAASIESSSNNSVFISTNSGLSFISTSPDLNENDHAKRVAYGRSADNINYFYVSYYGRKIYYTNSASNPVWYQSGSGSKLWTGLSCSTDGNIVIATAKDNKIYVSNDHGQNFDGRFVNKNWSSCSISSDGLTALACVDGEGIYISKDSGITWNNTQAPSLDWTDVAISTDGDHYIAVASTKTYSSKGLLTIIEPGNVYVANSYLDWIEQSNLGTGNWTCASINDNKMVVLCSESTTGKIYMNNNTTTPGTKGYLLSDKIGNIDLLYIGNDKFFCLNSTGNIIPF